MTLELFCQANELDNNAGQCQEALNYMTHGVFHRHDEDEQTCIRLPEEVCMEIRQVIEKWKKYYDDEFEKL